MKSGLLSMIVGIFIKGMKTYDYQSNHFNNHHVWPLIGTLMTLRRTPKWTPVFTLLYLFPCQSWFAPQDPLGTYRSPLLSLMVWDGSVHSNNCNSSTDNSKNNSQSRCQWWQTGSRKKEQSKTEVRSDRYEGVPEIRNGSMYS